MDNDDFPIGRVLSRREALALLASASAAMFAACAPGQTSTPALTRAPSATDIPTSLPAATSTLAPLSTTAAAPMATALPTLAPTTVTATLPSCIVRPEQTEGPYFVDEKLNRSDIRSDPATGIVSEGISLILTFNVSQISSNGCVPMEGAQVDVWHCDAFGVYSDVQGSNETKFLRGYQVTDANGIARFETIYPGWYQGRTVHIHFKIRNNSASQQGFDFTSQLYFDDSFSDQVFAQSPYSSRSGRRTTNSADGVYRNSGDELVLAVAPIGGGYSGTFDIGLQMN